MSNIINKDLRKIIIMNKTKIVQVGNILIGGGNPITVQSMTNTDTRDIKSTVRQLKALDKTISDTFENNFSSVESCSIFSGIASISPKISKKLELLYTKFSNSSVALSNSKDLTLLIFFNNLLNIKYIILK